ncbi:MAG TPA: hypothetical protein VGM54_11480 [Chthoniobacter sp.]|jgi:hypothetical protein
MGKDRAQHSAKAAIGMGVLLFAFVMVASFGATDAWIIRSAVVVGLYLAVLTFIWGVSDPNIPSKHWIGNPTMAMLAGVAGAVVAIVTFTMGMVSVEAQGRDGREQAHRQAVALSRIEAELVRIRERIPEPAAKALGEVAPTPTKSQDHQ